MTIKVEFYGETYEFPDGTSEEEQQKALIAEEHKMELPELNTTDDWGEYLWNQVRVGVGDSFSLAGAALDTLFIDPIKNVNYKGIAQDPSIIFDTTLGWDLVPFTDESKLGEKFMSRFGEYTDLVSQLTGADPTLQPETKAMEYAGMGVRVASDPLGYLGAPAKVAALATRGAGLTGVGVGSVVGGDVGEATGLENGRMIGSIIGGLGAPTISTVTARTVAKPIRQIYKKYKEVKANPQLAEQAYATGAAKRLLKLMAKEEGVDDIGDIVKEFSRLGKFIDGKELPLMVAMSDNPIVQSQVIRLAKTNEAFRHEVNKELQRLGTQVDNKSNLIFGTRYAEVAGLENSPALISKKVNALSKKRALVDGEIETLSETIIPTMTEQQRGKVIISLIEKREKIARAEMSPHYDVVLNEAKAANARMPAESVNSIYQFVKQNRLSDVFGKGTALDNKISAFTKPRKVTDKQGRTVTKSPTMSFEQVDSLKRAINTLKRRPLNATEQRHLGNLEDVIDAARESIPGNFNVRLKAVDKLYYERVGIPFGTAGMKQVNAKKYAEEVAPVILKNESALDSFLNVSGKEGNVIARNAYLSKVYDKVVKEGAINSKSLRALMKKDSSIINKVPGLKGELEDILVDNGKLFVAKDELNTAFKMAETEVANNFLITSNLSPNYAQVAQRLAQGDTAFLSKIRKDMSKLDSSAQVAINNNIKREFLTYVFDRPEGAIKYLTNPKNKSIVSKVFENNKTYISDVKDLSKISDALKTADVGRLSSIVTKADLDVINTLVPGLDFNYASSTFRDRIASPVMKATRILSRIQQEATRQKVDSMIIELLLDPKGVHKLSQIGKTFNFKLDNPLALKSLKKTLGETLPSFIYSNSKDPLVKEEKETRKKVNSIKY